MGRERGKSGIGKGEAGKGRGGGKKEGHGEGDGAGKRGDGAGKGNKREREGDGAGKRGMGLERGDGAGKWRAGFEKGEAGKGSGKREGARDGVGWGRGGEGTGKWGKGRGRVAERGGLYWKREMGREGGCGGKGRGGKGEGTGKGSGDRKREGTGKGKGGGKGCWTGKRGIRRERGAEAEKREGGRGRRGWKRRGGKGEGAGKGRMGLREGGVEKRMARSGVGGLGWERSGKGRAVEGGGDGARERVGRRDGVGKWRTDRVKSCVVKDLSQCVLSPGICSIFLYFFAKVLSLLSASSSSSFFTSFYGTESFVCFFFVVFLLLLEQTDFVLVASSHCDVAPRGLPSTTQWLSHLHLYQWYIKVLAYSTQTALTDWLKLSSSKLSPVTAGNRAQMEVIWTLNIILGTPPFHCELTGYQCGAHITGLEPCVSIVSFFRLKSKYPEQ